MKNIKRNYVVLVPVGIALLSFITGGAVSVHLLSRENDNTATTIIYFSFLALILSTFLFGIFWVVLGRVRRSIEENTAEREATEKELMQTELWYRSVFDGVNDAVLVETAKGQVLDVNTRACEMFGWTRYEFLTKTIRDMVPPEYQALLPEEQDETTISEEPFETMNMRANGEIFPVSVSGRLQIIGEEKRLLIVLRDITEQKRIEEELKKQHQFLTHVIESLSQPFYVINVDDYSIEISNSAARGKKALPVGTTCYALTHHRDTPCSGDDHPCPLKDVVKLKKVVQYEHLHYDQDGNLRIFEVHGYPIFNAQGEIKQMIEYSLDITERKKAEEELHKLSRAVTYSPSSVVITDANAKISYVNPAYLERGYTEDEVLGQYATFLYSDLHPQKFYMDIWEKVSTGDMWRGEIGSRTRQGETVWDAVSIAPIVDEKGNITNFVGVMEDITANKELLKETEKAKEAAEAAAQAKADFLANMSHEIRTPLNAIYGMTSLMLDTPLNAEQQDFIETIRGGSDTLLKVINDILDFSKIEAGKMELETQPFYIRNCVEDALDLLAEKAASKMLDLAYFVEDDTPPVVIGDITRVRQILVNLLNNAIKFTDKGEIVVNVKSMLVENDQHEITFSVRDTGIGIPADKIDKLFKSFSQVDTSTTRKYGGTGLGLAISNQLAENMGGRMWVKSEEGDGSTFYFTILVKAQQNAKPLYAEDDVPQLSGKRILIVDDNETNRLILIKQTESWGMKPRALSSGPEALTLLAQGEKFDIAILDMQMPEMDGFTLAQKISEKKKNTLPLIILTSIKREKTRSSDARISAFLNKPIKTSNLFNVLMGIIDTASVPQAKEKKTAKINGNIAERHPLRILLAEDNVINQKVALKLLSKLGYQADLAGNGLEVIEALDRQTYDLVLMDIQMPEMDGDEATRQIRAKWSQDRQPHIVAMTAHALEGDREKYIARGMNDYVSKPIKVDSLIAALKKVPRID